jgi:hypothetical protein
MQMVPLSIAGGMMETLKFLWILHRNAATWVKEVRNFRHNDFHGDQTFWRGLKTVALISFFT